MKILSLQALISVENGINNENNSADNDLAIYCMDLNTINNL